MRNLNWLLLLALVIAGCDTFTRISASADVTEPLREKCVIEALRKADPVLSADKPEYGDIPVVIPIPENIPTDRFEDANSLAVGVSLRSALDDEHPYIEIYTQFLGRTPEPPEFEDYVQSVLDDLLSQVVEQCGPAVTIP